MDESMWTIRFGKVFEQWLFEQEEGLQDKVLADLLNLQHYSHVFLVPMQIRLKAHGISI